MKSTLHQLEDKVYPLSEIAELSNKWRSENDQIVFTNGCFDILHYGHLSYLARTAELADKLVVGVNSDSSIKSLNKGDDRPLQSEKDRALILAALHFVDAVVIFSESTPQRLIENVRPHIIAKGGDYRPEEVVGKDVVESYGGHVEIIPFVNGYSTTSIVEKSERHWLKIIDNG